MQQYNVESPFKKIVTEVVGPFPETEIGNKYIFIAMDYFSNWVEAYAKLRTHHHDRDPRQKKKCHFGGPLKTHFDNGRN